MATERLVLGPLVLCQSYRSPERCSRRWRRRWRTSRAIAWCSASAPAGWRRSTAPTATPSRTAHAPRPAGGRCRSCAACSPSAGRPSTARTTTLPDAPQLPKPKRLPIMLGSASERLLRLVARHADAWNSPNPAWKELAAKRARLVELCAEAGRDPSGDRGVRQVMVELVDRERHPGGARTGSARARGFREARRRRAHRHGGDDRGSPARARSARRGALHGDVRRLGSPGPRGVRGRPARASADAAGAARRKIDARGKIRRVRVEDRARSRDARPHGARPRVLVSSPPACGTAMRSGGVSTARRHELPRAALARLREAGRAAAARSVVPSPPRTATATRSARVRGDRRGRAWLRAWLDREPSDGLAFSPSRAAARACVARCSASGPSGRGSLRRAAHGVRRGRRRRVRSARAPAARARDVMRTSSCGCSTGSPRRRRRLARARPGSASR